MKIHFIGIGGIGVSALAQYYLTKGHEIVGSDLVSSEIIENLTKKGIKIYVGKHKAENIAPDVDLVIYSPAVQQNNCELERAKKLKLQTLTYPEALGELTKQYFTIAICGSHGKSTTSAMTGLLLANAGLDPTVIIGTKLKEFGNSNYLIGKSKYLVIEADEHFESFLNYFPKIIVITNIEADHLDYYKNLKNYITAFKKFIFQLPKNGWLITNKDDKNTMKIINYKQISDLKIKNKNYSLKQFATKKLEKILKIPGRHNISNALAVLMVGKILKIPNEICFKSLSEYKNSWRRFEEKDLKYKNLKLKIINDYGHHPTEIKVTLQAAREKYPNKKIWCIFQPHQYQRTFYLFKDFVNVLSEVPVNKLIITDIYEVNGREDKAIKKKVSSKKLVEEILKKINKTNYKKEIKYISKINQVANFLEKNLQGEEVIIIMGAGDIYKLNSILKNDRN